MATITHDPDWSRASYARALRAMTEWELRATECLEQGAIQTLSRLLRIDTLAPEVHTLLDSAREAAAMQRSEVARRGLRPVFEHDQTGFT